MAPRRRAGASPVPDRLRRAPARPRSRRAARARDDRVRDVGRARARRVERGARDARADRRQPRGRAGGPRPPVRGLVGRHDRPGCADRHESVLRRVPERPRRLPGHDRAGVRRARRPPVRLALSPHHDPRPGRRRGVARRPPRDRPVVRGRRRIDGRDARARVGGRVPRPRRAARSSSPSARRRPPSRSRCARCRSRAIRADPNWRGGDYYDAAPGDGPHVGMSIARGIGQISYRSELEFDTRFGRDHQGDENPLEGGRYAVESYLEYHGEKLARRFDANTYIVLVGRDEPPRRRARARRRRGGAGARSRRRRRSPGSRRTASTRCACSTSWPSSLPTADRASTVIESIIGHDGFLVELEAVGKVVDRALD